jgi:hypothetical protein
MNPTPDPPPTRPPAAAGGLLRHYPAAWARHDPAAGLVLTAMLVPVGIAYAVACGLPGIHGLYATIAALLALRCSAPAASWCGGRIRRWPR